MANALYDAFKQEQMGDAAGPGHGAVDWEADTLKAMLADGADYTPNTATDQDFTDVTAAGRIGSSGGNARTNAGTIANATVAMAGGTATMDGDNVTLTSVTGDQAEYVFVFKDDGVADASSLLIALYDTFDSGMPVTPNGGDININWNASGLFTW